MCYYGLYPVDASIEELHHNALLCGQPSIRHQTSSTSLLWTCVSQGRENRRVSDDINQRSHTPIKTPHTSRRHSNTQYSTSLGSNNYILTRQTKKCSNHGLWNPCQSKTTIVFGLRSIGRTLLQKSKTFTFDGE